MAVNVVVTVAVVAVGVGLPVRLRTMVAVSVASGGKVPLALALREALGGSLAVAVGVAAAVGAGVGVRLGDGEGDALELTARHGVRVRERGQEGECVQEGDAGVERDRVRVAVGDWRSGAVAVPEAEADREAVRGPVPVPVMATPEGVGEPVGVGVRERRGVRDAVAPPVADRVTDAVDRVDVPDSVSVGDPEEVAVPVRPAAGVGVRVWDGGRGRVADAVAVGVPERRALATRLAVSVGVAVGERLRSAVAMGLGERVAVAVGVRVREGGDHVGSAVGPGQLGVRLCVGVVAQDPLRVPDAVSSGEAVAPKGPEAVAVPEQDGLGGVGDWPAVGKLVLDAVLEALRVAVQLVLRVKACTEAVPDGADRDRKAVAEAVRVCESVAVAARATVAEGVAVPRRSGVGVAAAVPVVVWRPLDVGVGPDADPIAVCVLEAVSERTRVKVLLGVWEGMAPVEAVRLGGDALRVAERYCVQVRRAVAVGVREGVSAQDPETVAEGLGEGVRRREAEPEGVLVGMCCAESVGPAVPVSVPRRVRLPVHGAVPVPVPALDVDSERVGVADPGETVPQPVAVVVGLREAEADGGLSDTPAVAVSVGRRVRSAVRVSVHVVVGVSVSGRAAIPVCVAVGEALGVTLGPVWVAMRVAEPVGLGEGRRVGEAEDDSDGVGAGLGDRLKGSVAVGMGGMEAVPEGEAVRVQRREGLRLTGWDRVGEGVCDTEAVRRSGGEAESVSVPPGVGVVVGLRETEL